MTKTILAIDDDEAVLTFYKIALARFGAIRTATNLADARQQLPGVDLIILDFDLAQDKELFQDVAKELMAVAPLLLCSGVQDVQVPSFGVSLGIAGYWNKQSDRESLFALVQSVLHSANKGA